MQDVHFVYNTSLDELIMPEYGRMVQDLVLHCKAIEDPKYRQSFAETVIELMQIMTPYNRNFEEHRKKLWHHFFRIAQYKIDVIPPTGIIPTPENDIIIPEKIEYPHALERNRHYGNYVNAMIQKAITLEDPKKKMAFAVIMASYMKMAFKNWNKEHYVSDEIIKEDLFNMSKGVLEIPEETVLEVATNYTRHQKIRPNNYKGGGKNQKHYNKPRNKSNFKSRRPQ